MGKDKNIILVMMLLCALWMTGCETTAYPEQFLPQVILDSYMTIGDTVTVELTHSESILTPYDSVAATIADAKVVVAANGLLDTLTYSIDTIPTLSIQNGDTIAGSQIVRHYKSKTQIVQPNTHYLVTAYLSDGNSVHGETHSPNILRLIADTTTTHDGDTLSFGHGYGRPMALHWNGDSLVSTYWVISVCHDTLQPKLRQESRIGGREDNSGGRRTESWLQQSPYGIVPWFFFDCQGWYTIKVYNIEDEFKRYLFSSTHNLDQVGQIQMNVVGGLGMVTAFSVDSVRVFVTP